MIKNIYAREIVKLAQEYLNEGMDVGDGSYYNFDASNTPLNNPKYGNLEMIMQIGVDSNKDTYGSIWLLPYYWVDEKNAICDHDDIDFYDLTENQQRELLENFIKAYVKTKTSSKSLIDYIKVSTLEDKVKLIEKWEEDRGSDGEYVYDLDNDEDSRDWIGLYGAIALHECRKIGRYWMGGWQFSYKDINKQDGIIAECWNINDASFETFLKNSLASEIEDRYEILIDTTKPFETDADIIAWINKIYGGLIDFEGYAIARGDFKAYYQYAWIARSNDGSYENASVGFLSMESCYESMREAVLEKMTWNTEWEDVQDCLCNTDHIHYEVKFNPSWIEHTSYSGRYLYKIVRCDADGNLEPNAWENLDEELKVKKL